MKIVSMDGKVLVEISGNTLLNAHLLGVDLHNADLQGADLRYADLQFANLWRATLCKATLRNANLQNTNLREADFQESDLRGADLKSANLSQAKLKGALLPHFDETPVIHNIHKTIYEVASAPSALDMSSWHNCETTHCRAGWVVTLAGKAGKALERKIGTNAAAALVYMKSDPSLEQIPDWHTNDEEALEDMRRLAA